MTCFSGQVIWKSTDSKIYSHYRRAVECYNIFRSRIEADIYQMKPYRYKTKLVSIKVAWI